MPDLDLLLESMLEYVADNAGVITASTITFGLLCLVLFRRHKYLRLVFLLVMMSGPALALYASKHFEDDARKLLPQEIVEEILANANLDFNSFKASIKQAVQAGKLSKSTAEAYLQRARRSYHSFSDKMDNVPRSQRKAFEELKSRFKDEIERAKEALGGIDFD